MSITLNPLQACCLSPFHLVLLLRICLVLSFGVHSSVSSFCLAFCVCFYELDGTATSLKLEKVVLCMVNVYVDSLCLLTLAAWLELWLVCRSWGTPFWACPDGMARTEVGMGCWDSLCRGCSDGAAGAEAGISWEVPECCVPGVPYKPSGAKLVWSWSVLACFASVSPRCNGWSCSKCYQGCVGMCCTGTI